MNVTTTKRRGESKDAQTHPMRLMRQPRLWTGDPLGFNAGDSNLYRYVANDPANATDPSGLQDLVHWSVPPGTQREAKLMQEREREQTKRAIESTNGAVMNIIDGMKNLVVSRFRCALGKRREKPIGLLYRCVRFPAKTAGAQYCRDTTKNLTPAEKVKVKKEIQFLLDASRFNWPHETGFFGNCDDWVFEYQKNTGELRARLGKEMEKYFQVGAMHWDNARFKFLGAGHSAIQIMFADGTVLYLDDGNVGGLDHVFVPSEIPSHYHNREGFPILFNIPKRP